jgi:outer membrane immunogenic protein
MIGLKTLRIQTKRRRGGEKMMKKFLRGAIGLVALGLAAPAFAADLPVAYSKTPTLIPVAYDWSGLYVGSNGGWGSGHKCWDQNTGIGGTFFAAEGCHDATGGVAGGQFGYRLQSNSWVFGVEVQGDWADLRGSNPSLITPPPVNLLVVPSIINQSRIDGLGLLTGQIGYAFNTALLYVKGGGAVTWDRYRGISATTGAYLDGVSETRFGGTVGVGLEYAFAPNWSAAIEYDRLFMGTRTMDFYATSTGTFTREDRIRQDVDLVTVRVNYRWGGPVIAKY